MLDFAWVGIPIFIVGGIYMIVMNRWCASYDDFGEETEEKALTSGQRRKQMVVGITFLVFVAALVLKIPEGDLDRSELYRICNDRSCSSDNGCNTKEALESLDSQMILFCAGINLMIAVMNQSGLGQVFGDMIINIIGESKNLYLITAVLCIGASVRPLS